MDALAGLLDGPRARGAFLLRSILEPPWSLRIQDEAPLTVAAVVAGGAWVVPDEGAPTELRAGDVAIIRGPAPYTVADEPATEPQVVVHPDQSCTDLAGNSLTELMDLGVRTWGNHPHGSTVLLCGTYQLHGEVSAALLNALPTLIVLAEPARHATLVDLLAAEIGREEPGQEAVLDRLLDLLLVATLRSWFARPDVEAPGWYAAQSDPVVGRAIRLLHHHPDQPWTVAGLAAATGVSRAALARRFTELVGEPPMAFLTSWRLTLAADLLREPGASVGSVARQVGYGSPFALSTAFKRVRGVSPRQHQLATAG